jgi:Kef-type K+ transport system membrane component KefB
VPPLTSAAIVAAVALLVPLALRLARVRVPDIVVQILVGVVLGPQLLGWVEVDQVVRVFSVVGLGFLLLLAGLEVDLGRLRGPVLRRTATAYAASFVLALAAGLVFRATEAIQSATLVAVILSATSLGIVLPVLEDAGQAGSAFGQVVVAGASLAEVVPIVLLSLLFSTGNVAPAAQVMLFAVFLALTTVVVLGLLGLGRSARVTDALLAL